MSKDTTKFRIPSSKDGGLLWKLLPTTVVATNRDTALAQFAAAVEIAADEQVSAVPARSWMPVIPKRKVTTTTTFQKVGVGNSERVAEGAAV